MPSIKRIINNPYKFIFLLDKLKITKLIPDDTYLRLKYRATFGKNLNLKVPQTFNEKLQWLKLYDRNPEYIKMVDKYEVKKYIAQKIGNEYVIPTLGVWDNVDDIDFDSLPDQFVLKCTHDSGGIIICKDKSQFDVNAAKKTLKKSIKCDYYLMGREWPYKNVKRRIIAEKFMVDNSGDELKDYKLMCFNGKVKCSFVCSERFSDNGLKVTFFDRNWKKMPLQRHYPFSDKEINPPINYNKMIELAEQLSADIPFVRVDFYEIDKMIFFGELTFYPGGGFEEFTPEEWDKKLGNLIELGKE